MNQPKNSRLTVEQVEQLRQRLHDLPPKTPTHRTGRQVIADLEAEIREALTRGYSVGDIAAVYAELGSISPSTLQSYLRDLRLRDQQISGQHHRPAAPFMADVAPQAAMPQIDFFESKED